MSCNAIANEIITREHKWVPGKYDGQDIETCVRCGSRKDGIPWITGIRPRLVPNKNAFYSTCPAIVHAKSCVPGISYFITFGCGGYGEVALHHPAARTVNGEMTLVEENVAICQRCRGAGIRWSNN